MQMHSKTLLALSLGLLFVLGGCNKKKSTDQSKNNSSLFSKKSKKNKHNRSVNPLDLDADAMKTFALDDKLSKHAHSNSGSNSDNPTFSWENIDAEKSKQQFKTIYFDFDKDDVKPSENVSLNHDCQEAKAMVKKGKTVVVEGHACHSAGSAAYNLAISERRARNVAEKLVENGVNAQSIKIAPRGQEMPVRKGGSRSEQWVNRRVELYAIDSNQ
ncbi:OmpA family protein [Candidatus Babeliales bacterium]|nr:OmpA family protein [Candidatus Babeliales bacterium]